MAEETERCPECGANLRHQNSIRIGNRHQRQGIKWLGFALALLGLSIAIGIGIPAARGYNWFKVQPVWMLVDTATNSTKPARADAARQELLSRHTQKRLDQKDYERIIRAALSLQADRSKPWDFFWGDMIEYGRAEGLVTDDQWRQFITEACRWKLVFKPEVVVGNNLLFHFELDGDQRTASPNFGNVSYISPDDPKPVLTIEGTDVDGNPVGPIAYKRQLMAGWGTAIIQVDIVRELALPPGEYTASVSVAWSVYDASVGMPQGPMGYSASVAAQMRALPTSSTTHLSYRSTFRIVTPAELQSYGVRDESLRRKIERDLHDAALQNPIRPSRRGLCIHVMNDRHAEAGRTRVDLTPFFKPAPLGLCHTVWMRLGDIEVKIGQIVSEPRPGVHGFSLGAVVDTAFLDAVAAQDQGPFVEIILRPEASLMSGQIDTFSFLDEELVVPDVEVVYDNP